MLLELVGVDDVNKGGELMMRTVLERLGDLGDFAVGHWGGPYAKRARLGLYQKLWIRRLGRFGGVPGQLIPDGIRKKYGLVIDDDVDAFLDASGFGYTDQWGARAIETAAALARTRARRGKAVILLPQAFGPFATRRSRAAASSLVRTASLVYAREPTSLGHLHDLVGDMPHIKLCPDFTNSLTVTPRPDLLPVPPQQACAIIPNYRMVDKAGAASHHDYVDYLARCVERTSRAGLAPFFLIHETDRDADLAEAVARRMGRRVPMLRHADPVAIKGAIAACALVIGSRYHGLVSALSQGVPALGSGWSHKYAALFRDYGFHPAGLVIDTDDATELDSKLTPLLDGAVRNALRERLLASSSRQKATVEQMWHEVRSTLEGAPTATA